MTDTEINEAVARKLGWVKNNEPPISHPLDNAPFMGWVDTRKTPGLAFKLPDYCHSIEAAWEIVEKEHKDGYFRMTDDYEYTANGKKIVYRCIFGMHNSTGFAEAIADIAPMAICLAFLKLSD